MKTEINPADYCRFIITGTDRTGKRFRMSYPTEAARFVFAFNLYNGSIWGVRVSNGLAYDGKRELLKRVIN